MHTAILTLENYYLGCFPISALKNERQTAAEVQFKSSKDSLVKALYPWLPQERQIQQQRLDWTNLPMGRTELGRSQESPQIPFNSVLWRKWQPFHRTARGSSKLFIFLNKNCVCSDLTEIPQHHVPNAHRGFQIYVFIRFPAVISWRNCWRWTCSDCACSNRNAVFYSLFLTALPEVVDRQLLTNWACTIYLFVYLINEPHEDNEFSFRLFFYSGLNKTFVAAHRFGDDWKKCLELPPKDTRVKTSVSLYSYLIIFCLDSSHSEDFRATQVFKSCGTKFFRDFHLLIKKVSRWCG